MGFSVSEADDLVTNGFQVSTVFSQDACCGAVGLADECEQDVLGGDLVAAKAGSLNWRALKDLHCAWCERG